MRRVEEWQNGSENLVIVLRNLNTILVFISSKELPILRSYQTINTYLVTGASDTKPILPDRMPNVNVNAKIIDHPASCSSFGC